MRISDWSSDVCSSDLAAVIARSCAFAEFIDSRIIAIRVAGSSICVARFAVTEATELPEPTSSLGRIDTGAMAFNGLWGRTLTDCKYLTLDPAHTTSERPR